MKSSPRLLQLEKACVQQRRPNEAPLLKKNYMVKDSEEDISWEGNTNDLQVK